MTAISPTQTTDDLPPDNNSRIAIFDALATSPSSEMERRGVSVHDLFALVIPRLRVLVPRELHIATEHGYVEDKIAACVESGLLAWTGSGRDFVALTGRLPQIRYPDGAVRDYQPGLEPARERLEADNAKLRQSGFNVRNHVPSVADAPDSLAFRSLVASMREHGYLRQFPVTECPDGTVLDGHARVAAAATAGVTVERLAMRSKKDRAVARRRDTPIQRVLLRLDANRGRLSDDVITGVYAAVSEIADRPWPEIAADIALTREWRRALPPEYTPRFEVRLKAYRTGGEAKVQVTADDKVMLRSLLESAGLTNWKIKDLKDHVPIEEARTERSAGRKAGFARIADLVSGIETMQEERRTRKLRIDPEWEGIRTWLIENFGGPAA